MHNNSKIFLKPGIITLFCFVLLFSSSFIFSQVRSNEKMTVKADYKYGEIIEIKLNENVLFEDSLSIKLKSFSHKRPFVGGPTKATAYLTVFENGVSDEIMLSVHGIEGKSEDEDKLSDSERFDSLLWRGYEFQLKRFNYDKSIELIVFKQNKNDD